MFLEALHIIGVIWCIYLLLFAAGLVVWGLDEFCLAVKREWRLWFREQRS